MGRDPSTAEDTQATERVAAVPAGPGAAEPVLGRPPHRTATASRDRQNERDECHDAVVAEAWLGRQAECAHWTPAYVAGPSATRQHGPQDVLPRDWFPAWRKVDRRADRRLG